MKLIPNSASLEEANPCHTPAGSGKGGQFCSKKGAAASTVNEPATWDAAGQERARRSLALAQMRKKGQKPARSESRPPLDDTDFYGYGEPTQAQIDYYRTGKIAPAGVGEDTPRFKDRTPQDIAARLALQQAGGIDMTSTGTGLRQKIRRLPKPKQDAVQAELRKRALAKSLAAEDAQKFAGPEQVIDYGSTPTKLTMAVTAFDRKQSGRPGYNRFALPQYFTATNGVLADMAKGHPMRKAILNNFTGPLARHMLKSMKLAPMTREEDR